jgi:hypothetical protein
VISTKDQRLSWFLSHLGTPVNPKNWELSINRDPLGGQRCRLILGVDKRRFGRSGGLEHFGISR